MINRKSLKPLVPIEKTNPTTSITKAAPPIGKRYIQQLRLWHVLIYKPIRSEERPITKVV